MGLGEGRVVPLGAGHRTTWVLLPQRVVLRWSNDAAGSAREVAVARFGATSGAPLAAPLDNAGPHPIGTGAVTLWSWVEHARKAGEADVLVAAQLLTGLHRGLAGYADPLPPYTEVFDRVAGLLTRPAEVPALSANDRSLLARRLDLLRTVVVTAARKWTPLHGDAHLGNLLLGGERALWIDLEDTCLEPPEFDIACLPPGAWPFFADVDPALIAALAAMRSVCVAAWCAARPDDDPDAREALAHHLGVVRAMRE